MLKENIVTPAFSILRKCIFSLGKTKLRRLFLYVIIIPVFFSIFTTEVFAIFTPLEINADSAILVESRRGQVFYEKQPDKKLHVSSANKIMTALLAIENGNLDSDVTISKEAATTEGSLLWLKVGEKYNVRQLVSAIILTAANDAAQALAEHVGGSTQKFVEKMNIKAKEIGLENTRFENPTGLQNENQYTTARDLAILIRYAITNPTFNSMFSYRGMTWIDGDTYDYFINANEMFQIYNATDGGKIGFNDPSKHSIITTASKNAQRLICIVLDAPPNSIYTDSVKLLDYGFDNFTTDILVFKNQTVNKSIIVGNTEVNLVSNQDVYYSHPIDDRLDVIKDIEFKITENLNPPVYKDTVIGTASYTLYDGTVINIPLYPDKEVKLPETTSSIIINKIKENKDLLYLLILLVAAEVILILYHIFRRIKKALTRSRQQIKS